jgi:hypothetical protein
MLWLLVTLGLMSCLGSESEILTVREPVVGKISAGETLKFKLTLPKGQRTSVTLIPLDGDADLFVLLPPTTPISQTPFKSTNVALQVERVILPAQPKETEAIVCVVGATETQFVLSVRWTKHRFTVEPSKTVLADIEWQEVSFSENAILGALTIANKTPTWFEVSVKPVGIDASKVRVASILCARTEREKVSRLGCVIAQIPNRCHLPKDAQSGRFPRCRLCQPTCRRGRDFARN